MLIAREKKKSNIAEYILYMWQVEDMLRGFGLDMERIKTQFIRHFQVDEKTADQVYDWYENLVEMMKKEKVQSSGHLQILKNEVAELTELHFHLLHQVHDLRYQQLVTRAAANLVDFRSKSQAGEEISDVELALNALYAQWMLKLQKREIHPQTANAMETFSNMIAYLASRYKKMEEEDTL